MDAAIVISDDDSSEVQIDEVMITKSKPSEMQQHISDLEAQLIEINTLLAAAPEMKAELEPLKEQLEVALGQTRQHAKPKATAGGEQNDTADHAVVLDDSDDSDSSIIITHSSHSSSSSSSSSSSQPLQNSQTSPVPSSYSSSSYSSSSSSTHLATDVSASSHAAGTTLPPRTGLREFRRGEEVELLFQDKDGGKWVQVEIFDYDVNLNKYTVLFLAPTRTDLKTCRFYKSGQCRFGTSCGFNHGHTVSPAQLRREKEKELLEGEMRFKHGELCLAYYETDGLYYTASIEVFPSSTSYSQKICFYQLSQLTLCVSV